MFIIFDVSLAVADDFNDYFLARLPTPGYNRDAVYICLQIFGIFIKSLVEFTGSSDCIGRNYTNRKFYEGCWLRG